MINKHDPQTCPLVNCIECDAWRTVEKEKMVNKIKSITMPMTTSKHVSRNEYDEVVEALMECFATATLNAGMYDHGCLYAYEKAQDLLLRLGKIRQEECMRT